MRWARWEKWVSREGAKKRMAGAGGNVDRAHGGESEDRWTGLLGGREDSEGLVERGREGGEDNETEFFGEPGENY